MPKHQAGYVLVFTLCILAAIAILAGYFAERTSQQQRVTGSLQRDADAALGIANAKAEMLYRLASTPVSPYGLGKPPNAIRLDDQPYLFEDRVVIRLQDARGQVALNEYSGPALTKLLEGLGVSAAQSGELLDKMLDYIDADEFVRIHGAEAAQYQAAGKPLPTNMPLVSPWELQRVLGWDALLDKVDSGRLLSLLCIRGVGINPNTAPLPVLMTLPGITRSGAEAVLERRAIAPIQSGAELAAVAQIAPESLGFSVNTLPSDSIAMTLAANDASWRLSYNVWLTPRGDVAPWQVDYVIRLPVDTKAGDPAAKPVQLPPRAGILLDISPSLLPAP